jgi:hypothetical protein
MTAGIALFTSLTISSICGIIQSVGRSKFMNRSLCFRRLGLCRAQAICLYRPVNLSGL